MLIKPKYRIKQIGNVYCPQIRRFLLWHYIAINTCELSYNRAKVCNFCESLTTPVFKTLDEANRFIYIFDNNFLKEFECMGWWIRSYYCEYNKTFYYSDRNTHNWYSDCSEQVCEAIALYEDKEKESKKVIIHEYRES